MEAEASKLQCPGRWYGTGSGIGVSFSHILVVWYGTGTSTEVSFSHIVWYGTGTGTGVSFSHIVWYGTGTSTEVSFSHIVWYGTGTSTSTIPYRGMVQLRIYVTFVPYGTVQLRKYITFATRVWYCNSHLRLEFTSQHTVNVKLARKPR